MSDFDEYLKARGDPNVPMELGLNPTQRFEIAHHINNPLAIAIYCMERMRTGQSNAGTREMLERNLKRIQAYVSLITTAKGAN